MPDEALVPPPSREADENAAAADAKQDDEDDEDDMPCPCPLFDPDETRAVPFVATDGEYEEEEEDSTTLLAPPSRVFSPVECFGGSRQYPAEGSAAEQAAEEELMSAAEVAVYDDEVDENAAAADAEEEDEDDEDDEEYLEEDEVSTPFAAAAMPAEAEEHTTLIGGQVSGSKEKRLLENASNNVELLRRDLKLAELAAEHAAYQAEAAVHAAAQAEAAVHAADEQHWEETGCGVCQVDDEEAHVLCDGCNYLFHTACVGLDLVPNGDWFCRACQRAAEWGPSMHHAGDVYVQLCERKGKNQRRFGLFVNNEQVRFDERITDKLSAVMWLYSEKGADRYIRRAFALRQ